jgi:hypothetical protein
MVAFIALALGLGFWPVYANVFGNSSYSCGSGFIHSAQHWKNDSQASSDSRNGGTDTAKGTPKQICPSKVLNRRDLALVLGSFALVVGAFTLALTSGPRDRSSTALLASQRLRR